MEVMQEMFEAEGIDMKEVLSMSLLDQVTQVILSTNTAIINYTTTMLIRLVLFLICLIYKTLPQLTRKQEKVLQGDSGC